MIFEEEECKEKIEWLMNKGLSFEECSQFLIDLELGNSFSLCLLKIFKQREKKMEASNEKNLKSDCINIVTP